MTAKYKIFLIIPCFLLMSATTFAADLWPMTVGMCMEFHKQDSSTPTPIEWTTIFKVAEEVTINSQNYFLVKRSNYNPPPDYAEFFIRSTEDMVCFPSDGTEICSGIGPVGTITTTPENGGFKVEEIISIAPITVPYGTFVAYGSENFNTDSSQPPYQNISPFWYNYFVPGIGLVKEVDFYLDFGEYPFLTAPTIMELVRFTDKCVIIGQNPVIGTGTTIKGGVEVGHNCEIGDGVTLNKFVTAGDNFKAGSNTIINQGVTICDDVELGDDVIIDKNVLIGSNVTIGNATVIGKNSIIGYTDCGTPSNITIGQGVVIGKDVSVAPNAVIGDFIVIPAGATVP